MSAVNLSVKGGGRARLYLNALRDAVGGASGVRAGFLENATYPPESESAAQGVLHVAQVAFWNEFGTSRAPARPFFRQMIGRELGDWGDKLGALLKAHEFDTTVAFGLMGTDIKDALTQSIAQWPADNAPATVKRKGFNHGLVDRGVMMRSTDFEVLD
jgi:hypothetical protein